MRLALSFGVGNTDKLFLSAITEAGARIIPTTAISSPEYCAQAGTAASNSGIRNK